jgi:hypothetical protein
MKRRTRVLTADTASSGTPCIYFVYRVLGKCPAQTLTASYWLHVELGKNIYKKFYVKK